MFILVRALIYSPNKDEIYRTEGKVFRMDTPLEKLREHVCSLICDGLSAMEIRIIKDVQDLCPGIDTSEAQIPPE